MLEKTRLFDFPTLKVDLYRMYDGFSVSIPVCNTCNTCNILQFFFPDRNNKNVHVSVISVSYSYSSKIIP